MASSSSASTPFSSQKKYDVFLSFRGDDTRDNFVSHLHESLSNSKILTFIDNNLERGEEIFQSLLDAIEASRISLVIFSENYASSKWCLNELVRIIECKEHHGQIVIPVFYRVDPSLVRKQTGSYAMAFTKHEQQIKSDMVKTWRVALEKAGNLSGWDSKVERPDTQLIKSIVSDVLEKLNQLTPVLLYHSNGLVGIDSRIEEILSLLLLESPNVRSLGIWGAGGIGKTTMATEIFKHICNKFEEHYRLPNAKEALKQHVLIPSEHRLLQIILKERSSHQSPSCLDPAFLVERFHLRKVLVILDDVDDLMGLQDLLRGTEASFGPGSRIILTSRDKHALEVADEIYEVEKLNHADALELFNLHAFKTDRPSEVVHLSEWVAEYAEGNPLALKVLGSALCGKCKEDWESALKDLSKVSGRGIFDVLRVSYDGLDYIEKKIFLYVAIFFGGQDMQLVKQILSSCFGEVQFVMSRLVEKALLAVNNKRLEMHNLLRELGKKIITEESANEIGAFNILCDPHKIQDILIRNKRTEAIEGLSLDLTEIEELFLEFDAFRGMDRLKVLQFYSSSSGPRSKVNFSRRGLKFKSDELRYLRWDGYPSKCLPVRFCAENLVSLQLRESKLKQLWEGVQNVVNLKQIDLSCSRCLITLPDLSKAVNIDEIHLLGCSSLEELPSSIQYLTKLKVLNLGSCWRLRKLPSSIQYLTKLEILELSFCDNLQKLPSMLDSPVLKRLDLKWSRKVKRCPKTSSGNLKYLSVKGAGIEEIPQSSLNELEELELDHCPNITKFPKVSENIRVLHLAGTGIKEIPSSIEICTRLTQLIMDYCKELLSIPAGICKLKSLEILALRDCSKLESFPEIQEPMPNLRSLYLTNCKELLSIPTSICKLKSLEYLCLWGCSKLESFPEIQEPMQSLWCLNLSDCKNLNWLPNSFHNLKSLKSLPLNGTAIKELPSSLVLLTCLESLEINGCKIGVEEWQQLLCLGSLMMLHLRSCNLMEIPISFCSLMHQLSWLDLSQNNFETLPPNFHQLSKLRTLMLDKCRRLRSLPELPESLIHLEANDCESLETISPGGRTQWKKLLLENCCKLDQGARDKLVADTVAGFKSQHNDPCMNPFDPSLTLLPGSEIPEFFNSYRGKGSSITIKMPSNINHRQLYSIAFCFVFASSSASTVLRSLKSMFLAPTPAEQEPISYCQLIIKYSVKGNAYEMARLELGHLGLVESDHDGMWQIRNDERLRFMDLLRSYPGKDVSFEWGFYDWSKPLKHYKVKKWGFRLFINNDNINIS